MRIPKAADWLDDVKRALDQLDPAKLEHALKVAADHVDAHAFPPSGGGGGRSDGQPPDPTGSRVMSPQRPDLTVVKMSRAMRDAEDAIKVLAMLTRQLSARAQDRPVLAGPCQNRFTHFPTEAGTQCALGSCRKPWPCRDGETESHVTDCGGTINPETGRCTRCEMLAGHWVCIDCPTGADVHGRDIKQVRRRCPRCYKAWQRDLAHLRVHENVL